MKNKDYNALEAGEKKADVFNENSARIVQDLSGYHWKMEKMRVGQGKEEGLHLLKNELSGNDFSWNTGHIPGDVYTDLYLAGEIEDPNFGRNMGKAKWVQEYEWWYNYAFNVSEEMKGKRITLVFEGVDYSCEVWLNNEYLGAHKGMYSSFEFDVTDIVDFKQPHVPVNLLTVKLDPPPKNQKNIAGMKHNFAGDYLTGLIPFGIWRPVKLVATDKVKIDCFRVDYKVSEDKALAKMEVEVQAYENNIEDLSLQITLRNEEGTQAVKKPIMLGLGENKEKVSFEIVNPKLWWPYELGEPNLYELQISILQGDQVLDCLTEKIGVREIKLQMNPGFTEEETKLPWTFTINGKPMFLRSACWGGQPSFFYGRNNVDKYKLFLNKAKKANINNLRIFGWHPPEVKEFYDICDELGLTVWTNFSFATQEFREDKDYIDDVKYECSMVVKERRNHPSMVMWMGGEEVFFSEAHVESGNRKLMERIGEVTKELTDVPYADASPLSSREGIRMGYSTKESAHANSHYYAAGAIFMEDYYPSLDYAIIPELTAASSPNVESLKKFIPENELWPMGPSYGYHACDLHVLQNLNYEVFGDIKFGSLEEFVEATQIAQGTIAQFSLEHFRRQKPHVSGVALCHFMTNWPIIKWDIVDYYGENKKSYEYVRRCYEPLLPSLQFNKRRWLPGENFEGNLYVINDYYKTYSDIAYQYEVLNADKQVVYTGDLQINIGENSSVSYGKVNWKVEGNVSESFYIRLTLKDGNSVIASNEYCLLIADQEEAKKVALELYKEMHKGRDVFGKGYYRYTPEMIENL